MEKLSCSLLLNNPKNETQLLELIKKFSTLEIINVFHDNIEIIEKLNRQTMDILFISVESEKVIQRINKPPFVIGICNSNPQITDRSQPLYFDYFQTPIEELAFCDVMSKIFKIANAYRRELYPELMAAEKKITYNSYSENNVNEEYIFIKSNKSSFKVVYDDVKYIKNVGNTLRIEMKDGKYIYYRSTLKRFFDLLPSNRFARINKSIVINFTMIDKFQNLTIWIQNETFAVSRIYVVRLRELLRCRKS